MLIAGSDDGIFQISGIESNTETTATKVLDAGTVMRIRQFEAFDGLFATTESGLYHSPDGETWTDLGVPEQKVYAIAASPNRELYAGTRPAHIYAAELDERSPDPDEIDWQKLDGFDELPSRDEWQLPRHDNLAQCRDVHVPAEAPSKVIAGVEVGGVHVSPDSGDSWTERRQGVDDDIHELAILDEDEFIAGTGFGLYRTTDGGQSWTRLDEGFEQRYFRSVFTMDGDVYAGAALAHTATWEDDDANPALFVSREGGKLKRIKAGLPDETVTGMTSRDGSIIAATHRGTILYQRDGGWETVGTIPRAGSSAVSYTPLSWVDSGTK